MKFQTKFFERFFVQSFLVLASGSLLAQFIQIISYPVLTRLFTPEDFGVKSFFSTILILLTVFSTGRYEEAIPIPKKDETAIDIITVSILLSLIFSILVGIFFLIFGTDFFQTKSTFDFYIFVFLIPLGILSISIINTLSQWSIRKSDFEIMSKIQVTQSFIKATFEMVGGLLGLGGITLVLGVLVGMGGGIMTYITRFLAQLKTLKIEISKSFNRLRFQKILTHFVNFPKFSIVASLLNKLNIHLPVLYFSKYATMGILGHYSIVLVIVAIPNAIIIGSILKVFQSELAKNLINNPSQLKKIFLKNVVLLTLLSFGLALLFFAIGKPIILFAFGNKWELAGEMLTYCGFLIVAMTWFWMSYYIFTLLEEQKILLGFNFLKFLFLLAGFYFGIVIESSEVQILCIYICVLMLSSLLPLMVAYIKLNAKIVKLEKDDH